MLFSNNTDITYEVMKVHYLSDIPELELSANGDWIDLYTTEDIRMRKGEYKEIPLGVAIELPQGYEALVVPRSSTYKKYGLIQTNGIGINEWHFPCICMLDYCFIPKHSRICKFRIIKHQPIVFAETVAELGNENRGGFGSTGN